MRKQCCPNRCVARELRGLKHPLGSEAVLVKCSNSRLFPLVLKRSSSNARIQDVHLPLWASPGYTPARGQITAYIFHEMLLLLEVECSYSLCNIFFLFLNSPTLNRQTTPPLPPPLPMLTLHLTHLNTCSSGMRTDVVKALHVHVWHMNETAWQYGVLV